MAQSTTKFQDLDLKNAFLFAAALEDPETCRMILEMILGHELPEMDVHVEHSLLYSSDFKSIRLDVYASDQLKVGYNLEMQNGEKTQLPKRSRFYQAQLDISALKPGQLYEELKPSYIIFICTFDPFDREIYRYTFEERCLERDFALGDETRKIFLNTKGTNPEEVPELLVNFLHYVENTNDTFVEETADSRIEELHEKIRLLKASRRWEAQYMTFEELLRDTREEGHAEGVEAGQSKGQNRMLTLISRMSESGEAHLIPGLSEDSALLQEMLEKYGL